VVSSIGGMGRSIDNVPRAVRRAVLRRGCGGLSKVRSSKAEWRWAAGRPGHPYPEGIAAVRGLLDELRGKLVRGKPESNRIEWLWRSLRRAVTHSPPHSTLPPLLEAVDAWADKLTPLKVLRQIGSPFGDSNSSTRPRHTRSCHLNSRKASSASSCLSGVDCSFVRVDVGWERRSIYGTVSCTEQSVSQHGPIATRAGRSWVRRLHGVDDGAIRPRPNWFERYIAPYVYVAGGLTYRRHTETGLTLTARYTASRGATSTTRERGPTMRVSPA
jgi:hypothetical protein